MKSVAKGAVPESGKTTATLISNAEEDHEALRDLFRDYGWTLHAVRSLDPALDFLVYNIASVVITERDLPFGTWADVVKLTQVLPIPPLVIVISRFADDYLWAEALNLGAYDVLAKPLVRAEVVRVLTSAWFQQLARQMHAARRLYKECAANYTSITKTV
jgi:FixJ family two-component response regulator